MAIVEPDTVNAPAQRCDILVVGGGPGGAAVATFLAEAGLDVVLVEKERHPRFHVGESLLPHSLPILERLGVLEQVREIGVYKPGAEFVSEDGAQNPIFGFDRALTKGPSHAYQVRRADFDKILFDRARDVGVRTFEDVTATVQSCDDSSAVITGRSGDGGELLFHADMLIDASGRSTITAGMRKERHADRRHNSAAIFAHFKGVPRIEGCRGGNIRIHLTNPGWMWQIPLTNGITSVGLVMPGDLIAGRNGTVEAFFHEHVARHPEMASLLAEAEPISEINATGNFSYRAERAFGPGHLRVGDAYGFIDPVFSTGVHLALVSAEEATQAVLAVRAQPARRTHYFTGYERSVQRRIHYVSWFIYNFDDAAFRELLLNPRDVLGVERAVISLLAGDFRPDWRVRLRVLLFKAIRKLVQLRYLANGRGNRRAG